MKFELVNTDCLNNIDYDCEKSDLYTDCNLCFNLSINDKTCLEPAECTLFTDVSTELVTSEDICYTKFCGNFVKTKFSDGTDTILPFNFEDGFTFKFKIRKNTTYNCGGINNYYPNNSGIFFMLGAELPNTSQDMTIDGNTLSGCTNSLILPDIEFEDDYVKNSMNPFLYYNGCSHKEPQKVVKQKDLCEGLCDNIMAFRINENGAIGFRSLCCIDDETVLVESYSNNDTIKDDQWHDVIISYNPSDQTLLFYVDGYLKHKVSDFKAPNFYSVNENNNIESYNISLGGGSYGNLCNDEVKEEIHTVNSYSLCMLEDTQITGIKMNGEWKLYDTPQDISIEWLTKELNICKENIKIVRRCSYKPTWQINIHNTIISDLTFRVKYNCSFVCGCGCATCRCDEIKPKVVDSFIYHTPIPCGLIENHFGGTFIGDIGSFEYLDRFQDIIDVRACIINEYKQRNITRLPNFSKNKEYSIKPIQCSRIHNNCYPDFSEVINSCRKKML